MFQLKYQPRYYCNILQQEGGDEWTPNYNNQFLEYDPSDGGRRYARNVINYLAVFILINSHFSTAFSCFLGSILNKNNWPVWLVAN